MNPIYPGMTVCLGDGGTGRVTDVLVDGQTEQERFMAIFAQRTEKVKARVGH